MRASASLGLKVVNSEPSASFKASENGFGQQIGEKVKESCCGAEKGAARIGSSLACETKQCTEHERNQNITEGTEVGACTSFTTSAGLTKISKYFSSRILWGVCSRRSWLSWWKSCGLRWSTEEVESYSFGCWRCHGSSWCFCGAPRPPVVAISCIKLAFDGAFQESLHQFFDL